MSRHGADLPGILGELNEKLKAWHHECLFHFSCFIKHLLCAKLVPGTVVNETDVVLAFVKRAG